MIWAWIGLQHTCRWSGNITAYCWQNYVKDKCVSWCLYSRTFCNRDVNALATYCKKLEQLDILGTREVTYTTIQRWETIQIQPYKGEKPYKYNHTKVRKHTNTTIQRWETIQIQPYKGEKLYTYNHTMVRNHTNITVQRWETIQIQPYKGEKPYKYNHYMGGLIKHGPLYSNICMLDHQCI